jgi:hypothetical protein
MPGYTHASLRHGSKFFMNELADDILQTYSRVSARVCVFVVMSFPAACSSETEHSFIHSFRMNNKSDTRTTRL